MGTKGDGSFFKRTYRRADGSKRIAWLCSITVLEGGKRRRKTFYGPKREQAAAARDAYRAQTPQQRQQQNDKTCLGAYLDRWLASKKQTTRPSTVHFYQWAIEKHIKPFIGDIRINSLEPLDIERLLSDVRTQERTEKQKPIGTRTIWAVYVTLRTALNRAVKDRIISHNPIASIDPPRHRAKKIAPLTREQAKRLLDAARGDRFHALYVLALSCGLRQGELFGLKWGDVDMRSGHLAVRRQAKEYPKKGVQLEDHTKTGRDRSIKLPPLVLTALREHRKRVFANGDIANEVIFTEPDGTLLRNWRFLRQSFFPLLVRAECPRIRFHDLRHTAATLAFEQGVHPKQVQEMLGHASVAFTQDVYTAFLPAMQDQVAEAMERALGR